MNKCPCEQCIILAICIGKDTIKCELLYDFLCVTHHSPPGFVEYKRGAGVPVHKLFNKFIAGTNFHYSMVELSAVIPWPDSVLYAGMKLYPNGG